MNCVMCLETLVSGDNAGWVCINENCTLSKELSKYVFVPFVMQNGRYRGNYATPNCCTQDHDIVLESFGYKL